MYQQSLVLLSVLVSISAQSLCCNFISLGIFSVSSLQSYSSLFTGKYCGLPPKLENGYILKSSGADYQSTVTFACYPEFSLAGNNTIQCNEDGEWTEIPSCIGQFPSVLTDAYFKTLANIQHPTKLYNIILNVNSVNQNLLLPQPQVASE